jgi:DNA polymerase-1
MFDLDKLYQGHKAHGDNPLCGGCSILEKSKPCHSVMDYEELEPAPVLFLSDSIKYKLGSAAAFTKPEVKLFKECYPEKFAMAAAVKCPSVKEADMSPNNMNLCRQHLDATIDKVKPKLVFACGNLAMKMLIKKSGITNKRGKSYDYTTGNSHSCVVVPIFHPYSCIKEPRHLTLFRTDISNAYEKYVLGKESEGDFSYKVLSKIEEIGELVDKLQDVDVIAVDTETTGLNFLTDDLMTISLTTREGTWVIPLDHKDSPFRKGQPDYARVWGCLRRILQNPKSRKVFHNAKFDLKFLINYGIYTKNVWDTKIMHHLLDENMPKGLMDLTKLYFANELENL